MAAQSLEPKPTTPGDDKYQGCETIKLQLSAQFDTTSAVSEDKGNDDDDGDGAGIAGSNDANDDGGANDIEKAIVEVEADRAIASVKAKPGVT